MSAQAQKKDIRTLTITALMTAVLCILAPLSIPIGPIPVSLTNLALYFMLYIVGTKITSYAYLLYMLLGLIGLPVFSGFAGGPQKLFGPTGGYIIGFLPMLIIIGVYLSGNYEKKLRSILVMELATWIPYMLGTGWLAVSAGMSFKAALAAGVLPFIVVDLVKICLAAFLAPEIKNRMRSAGVQA